MLHIMCRVYSTKIANKNQVKQPQTVSFLVVIRFLSDLLSFLFGKRPSIEETRCQSGPISSNPLSGYSFMVHFEGNRGRHEKLLLTNVSFYQVVWVHLDLIEFFCACELPTPGNPLQDLFISIHFMYAAIERCSSFWSGL